jgi:hypothetical protein
MQLPNLTDLSKVIDLCRKKGVSSITIGELKLEIREEAPQSGYKRRKESHEEIEADATNPYDNFPSGELSPEQLIYYSSGGTPEADPFKKDS